MRFKKELLTPCPIVYPNSQEFQDPIGYLSRPDIANLGSIYGIIKLVPPPDFKPGFQISPDFKFHTRLQTLSDLGITTRSRRFFIDNLNRFLKMRNKRQIRDSFKVYLMENPSRLNRSSSNKKQPNLINSIKSNLKNFPFNLNQDESAGTNHQESGLNPNSNDLSVNSHQSFVKSESKLVDTHENSCTLNSPHHSHHDSHQNPHQDLPPNSISSNSHLSKDLPSENTNSRSLTRKIYYYDVYVAVEKLGGINHMNKHNWELINQQFNVPKRCQDIKNQYEANISNYAKYLANHQNDEFPDSDSEDELASCLICGNHDNPSQTLLCDNCDNPFHMSCLTPKVYEVPDGKWYCSKCLVGTGEYGFEEDPDVKYTIVEFWNQCKNFDQEFIKNYNNNQPLTIDVIEKKFWEFVDVQKSDLTVKYGADIHNLKAGEVSGFPMIDTPGLDVNDPLMQYYINHPFNLTKLPFSKGSLLNYINHSISGMTIPWIYIGSLLATFCWHVEDHYTLSANYCHFGATKKWYGIPSSQADAFEKLMRDSAPDLFTKQPDLLHQLVSLLNPMKLIENGIQCTYANQNPGEYIITYPRVYHAGFNCGFNFNEAVNFTMDAWLPFGEKAIEDYKSIQKENVFSHYQLIENILRNFNHQRRLKRSKDYIKLVTDSCSSFENFLKRQSELLSKISLNKFTIVHKPRKMKNHLYEFDENEEESLCDICKTYVSYQYCVLDNSDFSFGQKKSRKFKQIPVKQLLTPEASPQEILFSIRSSRLTVPKQADLQKLSSECVMDEYDKLINDAKRAAQEEEEDSQASRRKLRRLEKRGGINQSTHNTSTNRGDSQLHKQEKFGSLLKQSLLKGLQAKPKIRLCLECNIKISEDHEIPENSILIYENTPSNLQGLIEETHRNIQELKIV